MNPAPNVVRVDVSKLDGQDKADLRKDMAFWPGVKEASFMPGGEAIEVHVAKRRDINTVKRLAKLAMDSGEGPFWDRLYRRNGLAWFEDVGYMAPKGTMARVAEMMVETLAEPVLEVLDVGCGPGSLAAAMAALPGWDERATGFPWLAGKVHYYGCDASTEAIGLASARLKAAGVLFPWWLTARPVEDLSRQFDRAALVHVLEHAADPLRLLASIRERLRPRGDLVVAGRLLSDESPRSPSKYRHNRFSPAALAELAGEAGFKVLAGIEVHGEAAMMRCLRV